MLRDASNEGGMVKERPKVTDITAFLSQVLSSTPTGEKCIQLNEESQIRKKHYLANDMYK